MWTCTYAHEIVPRKVGMQEVDVNLHLCTWDCSKKSGDARSWCELALTRMRLFQEKWGCKELTGVPDSWQVLALYHFLAANEESACTQGAQLFLFSGWGLSEFLVVLMKFSGSKKWGSKKLPWVLDSWQVLALYHFFAANEESACTQGAQFFLFLGWGLLDFFVVLMKFSIYSSLGKSPKFCPCH